ncbi:RDD family protein [Rhodoferax sp. BLA1]|uniref:RDD family protein n=1 Tax=Rhodoferax sp. BLA1 TaxID=2576062 RepID=UPI0015D21C5A|nr:RDD family protein [Rhodoferax sp. BLA1]
MQQNDLEYVGFWPRVGASVIDMLLQLAIMLPLTYAVYGRLSDPGRTFMGVGDMFINLLLPAAAVIAFWVYKSATPGKMALSARIVDADTGAPLTTMQSVIRYVGYFVSMIPLGVGFIWVAFDRRKQGWHDKMANSVVVRPGGVELVKFNSKSDWRNPAQEPRF